MTRIFLLAPMLALLTGLAGCETLRREPNQLLEIEALDAHDRPVDGMVCKIGDSPALVTLPAGGVPVRRSFANREIDCRRGAEIAKATEVPRRDGVEQALVPFGSIAVLIDHVTGRSYEYPTTLRLRVGRHVTLEHGGEARIVKTEILPQPASAVTAAAAAPAPAVAAAAPRPNAAKTAAAKPPAAITDVARAAVAKADAAKTQAAKAPAAKTAQAAPAAPAQAVGPTVVAANRAAPATW